MSRFLVGIILLLASWFCYSNSLGNGWRLDDHWYFDNTMKNLKFIPYHFLPGKGSILGMQKTNNKGHYRPLQRAIYTVLYVSFKENTALFHVVNILFLFSVGFFIYLILEPLFPFSKAGPLLGGLFFVMHPLNSTMINFISMGIYLAEAALMLLSLWFLVRDKQIWSVSFFLMAVLCHESALFLPLYAVVLVLALRLPLISRVWPLGAACAVCLFFSLSTTSVLEILFHNSPVTSLHMPIGAYVSTVGKVAYWYLVRLLMPTDIVFLWGVPIVFNAWWISVFIMLGVGLITALAFFWKKNNQVMFLGMGWIIAALVPGMLGGINRPGIICIEPHWVIFALIGFCVCLSSMVASIKNRLYAWLMCGVILISWFCLDRQYNVLWSNEKSYCYYWHGVFTDSAVPVYYLAQAYQGDNDLLEAKTMYLEAFKTPHYKESFDYNQMMGVMEVQQQHWEEARYHLERALVMQPDNPYLLTHLGIVAIFEKDNAAAEEYFKHAIRVSPFETIGRLDLAVLYMGDGNVQGAKQLYKEILEFDPKNEISLVELIKIYLQEGDKDNILKIAHQLSKISHNPVVLRNVGIIFQRYK